MKRRDLGAYLLTRHPHLKLSALSTLEPLALLSPSLPLSVALPRGLSGHGLLFESSLGTLAGMTFEQNAILSGHDYLKKVPQAGTWALGRKGELGRAPRCGSVCGKPWGRGDPGGWQWGGRA